MNMWEMVTIVALIAIGAEFLPKYLAQVAQMRRERIQAETEQMRIKQEAENRILGGDSTILENVAAELKCMREEMSQLRDQVNQLSSKVDNNYITRQ